MGYRISLSEDGKYIIIRVTGVINRLIAMEQNLEAHALGKSLGINRYLVDVREATNTDQSVNGYEFAHVDMRKAEGIDRSAVVAMLVDPNDHSHDFVETVSRNAGLKVTLFTDLDEARQYLVAED